MKVNPVPGELVAQTCLEMAALKQPQNHDPLLIEALVNLYNREPSPQFKEYQLGLQAGIRYTLLATNQRVQGINLKGGKSK